MSTRSSLCGKKDIRTNKAGIIVGLLALLIFVTVRMFCSNPYEMIHKLDTANIIPPLWLFDLLSFVWGFMIGYAAGSVIECILHGGASITAEISSYRGGLFFLTTLFLYQIWHSQFFCEERLILAIAIVGISLVTCIACSYFWSSVSKLSALILGAFGLWLFYLFILNVSVLLHI